MAVPMTDADWRAFVDEGTRTAKIATTRADGRPHVAPVWFLLDGDHLVFNTDKAGNLPIAIGGGAHAGGTNAILTSQPPRWRALA